MAQYGWPSTAALPNYAQTYTLLPREHLRTRDSAGCEPTVLFQQRKRQSRILSDGLTKSGVQLHAWVFMTNHVHLLVTPDTTNGVSKLMHYVGLQYARRFNYKYSRTGALFEGRYKSSVVQDTHYLLTCLRYIELNPVRAGIVKDPGDYHWSSYRCHGRGEKVGMWTPHDQYLSLAGTNETRQNQYRELIQQTLSADVVTKVRHCANAQLVLGTDEFREQVEEMRQ